MEPIISASSPEQDAELIKDTDTRSFMADVIEASQKVPVIVDFWAPWCGPCKQLGPILEKVVRAAHGKVRLVKLNIDENQQLAQQMRIQSIPAVYGFVGGRPVDGFVGVQTESQIKAFVEGLGRAGGVGPSPVEDALARAREALEQGDSGTAANIYHQVLQQDPDNVAAAGGVVRCLVAMGDLARARNAFDGLPREVANDPEIAAARSALELAEQGTKAGNAAALRQQVEANPDDHQARFDLALALYGDGDAEAAVSELLEIIGRDRTWNDEAARKQLLKFFEALGHSHPATVSGRRRLSSMLFS